MLSWAGRFSLLSQVQTSQVPGPSIYRQHLVEFLIGAAPTLEQVATFPHRQNDPPLDHSDDSSRSSPPRREVILSGRFELSYKFYLIEIATNCHRCVEASIPTIRGAVYPAAGRSWLKAGVASATPCLTSRTSFDAARVIWRHDIAAPKPLGTAMVEKSPRAPSVHLIGYSSGSGSSGSSGGGQ